MTEHVILIGPMGAGKSTLAELLAARLGVPRVSMDDVRFNYYAEIGYDEGHADRLRRDEGFVAVYRYWKRFEIHAVERLMAEHAACEAGCVVDFGAGHSVYEDPAFLARAEAALVPYPNVVLVLPSPDAEDSIRVLRERNGDPPEEYYFDLTRHFVTHPSNRALATRTVYTKDKTPEQTADEIRPLLV